MLSALTRSYEVWDGWYRAIPVLIPTFLLSGLCTRVCLPECFQLLTHEPISVWSLPPWQAMRSQPTSFTPWQTMWWLSGVVGYFAVTLFVYRDSQFDDDAFLSRVLVDSIKEV